MAGTRHRVGRAATLVVVAALTLLPISAQALSPAAYPQAGATAEEKEMAKLAKLESSAEKEKGKEEPPGNGDAAPGQNKEEPPGNSGAAPGQNKEEPSSPGDPTEPGGSTDPGGGTDPASSTDPGAVTEPTTAPGVTPNPIAPGPDPEPQGPAPDLSPAAPVSEPPILVGEGPPVLVPSSVVPTQGGLGALDPETLPAHVGAAVAMFEAGDAASGADFPDPVVPAPGPLSSRVVQVLSPALPPPLTDAVAAPFVVAEALVKAMASSGQALVLPVLAAVGALLTPRRRDPYADALEQE